jgi:His/Glu/Gln/Arg/opine family amino acid ABC transporter permease subunit
VSARIKRTINYVVLAAVVIGLMYYVFVPAGPDMIQYTMIGRNDSKTPSTLYLSHQATFTIGKNADISVPLQGSTALVAATISRTGYQNGVATWTFVSNEPSTTVTINGAPVVAGPMADGAVIGVDGVQMTYRAGRTGFTGFLDRLESDDTAHLFISPVIISGAFPIVAAGFPVSVAFGVLAFLIAIPLGLGLSFMKMAKTRWFRWPATFYVDVVRGTPMFLQILIVVFAIPLLPAYKDLLTAYPWLNNAGPLGVSYTYWMRGLVVLSFNSAAYMAEIFRAGIQSISKGQSEAARSLGMTGVQSMAFVILPQTVRRILPTMMSEFILLFKDTAMLSAVGVAEMVQRAREVAASTFNSSSYLVAAVFYLLLTIPLGRFVQSLENRLAISEGAGGAAADKAEVVPPITLDPEHVIHMPEPRNAGDPIPKRNGR